MRQVLRISGPQARDFLQGLVTNDVSHLDDGMVYAAMLTPQGKFRMDFFMVPDGDDVLLDVAASRADELFKALSMYKLRSPVEIARTEIPVSRGVGAVPSGAFADPRHPSLGWRGYHGQSGNVADWDALRVAACIPDSDAELGPDTFILEAGFERLNGVDFRKGCYVGQEVTARMKHKTELRKGFAIVQVQGRADLGTDILSNGKVAGTLFTQSGEQAIAYLRFDRAGEDMTAADAKVSFVRAET